MLTQVDIKRLPSYSIGHDDGEAEIVRRLLVRLDAAQVADLLGLSPEEVAGMIAKRDEEPCEPQ